MVRCERSVRPVGSYIPGTKVYTHILVLWEEFAFIGNTWSGWPHLPSFFGLYENPWVPKVDITPCHPGDTVTPRVITFLRLERENVTTTNGD